MSAMATPSSAVERIVGTVLKSTTASPCQT
jgi:hypothetical protein